MNEAASPAITAFLTIINSKMDRNGNRYWAFTYTDVLTGISVSATISGGESNISGIRRCMGRVNGWDDSIRTVRKEMPIREFQRFTKGLPYAGCAPEELASFIKKGIADELAR